MSVIGTLIQLSITTASKDTGNKLCDQRPCHEKDSKELANSMTLSSALNCSVTSGLYQEIPSDESSDGMCSKAFLETEPSPCINCAEAELARIIGLKLDWTLKDPFQRELI